MITHCTAWKLPSILIATNHEARDFFATLKVPSTSELVPKISEDVNEIRRLAHNDLVDEALEVLDWDRLEAFHD